MNDLLNINEAIDYLKQGFILKDNKKNEFLLKNKMIYYFNNGSLFKINIEDFLELFKESKFYIFEDNNIYIDDSKDEDYYRYYKK